VILTLDLDRQVTRSSGERAVSVRDFDQVRSDGGAVELLDRRVEARPQLLWSAAARAWRSSYGCLVVVLCGGQE